MPHEVETMFAVRKPPWHGLGKVLENAPTSEEAIKQAGLTWKVTQEPVHVNGRWAKPHVATVRSDTKAVLGIVTTNYVPVQNSEAFAWTDALIADGEVRYETAGSLREGRTVWLLARMEGHSSVLGDEVAPYLLFTNNHDGRAGIRVLLTPVRVVCWNTLNLALHGKRIQGSRMWTTRHTGRLDRRLLEARYTLGLARTYLDGLQQFAEDLAGRRVDSHAWEAFVRELIPIHRNDGRERRAELNRQREDLLLRIGAPDLANFRNTAWAAVNAVADHVAHVAPKRNTPDTRERRFERIADGHPMVDRAVKLLLAA